MVKKSVFGTMPDGKTIDVFTLTNAHGIEIRLINYGGDIISVRTPDRNGHFADIALGFDTLNGYRHNKPFFGALVGRFANRIGNARFELDGKTYTLAKNNGPNCLHGGLKGFDKEVWQAESFEKPAGVGVVLKYTSPDGEDNFPGTVHVTVTYTLTDQNEFKIDYEATTDKATPINLTNHSYFNLTGEGSGNILGTEMRVDFSTGTLAVVSGDPRPGGCVLVSVIPPRIPGS